MTIMGSSVKKAIKIYARIKPTDTGICKYEIDKHINDDGTTDDILILNPGSSSGSPEDDYQPASASVNRPDSYKFRFSKVFDCDSSQDSIFDELCQPVLESALQGYNSTIFAYGQTGSGKTYTMTGSRQHWKNRGIIPRSLSYIFEKFGQLTEQGFIASAFLSYLEIYNENGYDLLHPGFSSGRIEDLKKVQLLEDAQQQIHMKNLTVHPIKSEDEAMQLLYLGDHNRIIAETPMNEASTRSHCIFTIHLNIREADSSTVRRSKVHLVDLAGSERLSNSNSTGQLFHEARHINLALHYLEQVIVALGEAHRSHIPYRNSMMTSILRDSLGGNCMTSMVATISLELRNIPETLSTCRFSQRVALVQNAAILNEETDPMLLIAQLKLENKRLKDIIANSSIRALDQSWEPLSQEEVAECWKLVEKFIADVDEEAILPVAPDMRIVQTCFRCLKMAVQMTKEDIVGITPSETKAVALEQRSLLNLPRHHHQCPPDFVERSTERYAENLTRDQLIDCLRVRDAEIDVLTKMLRPNTPNKTKGRFYQQNFIPEGTTYEIGDGPQQHHHHPQQQQQKTVEKFSVYQEDQYDSTNKGFQRIGTVASSSPSKLAHQSSHENDRNNGTRNGQVKLCSSVSNAKENLGLNEFFDPDSLFIEGLSDTKKRALEIFIRSYNAREKLERARNNLRLKRTEVDSIETQLRRNHANLNNLKVVLMSSDSGGEEEDIFMREAVDAQSQAIQKQERQLAKSKEELRRIEENLKGIYTQLMGDFESYWNSRKEYRHTNMGVRGIPSEVDFALGASAASTRASTLLDNGGAGAFDDKESTKPLAEMTKGIVRGVGGVYNNQYYDYNNNPRKSARSRSSNLISPVEMQFSISTPAHQPTSAQACKSISGSSRRDKMSPKGKCPPMNTPRSGSESVTGRLLKAPPGTPDVHLLHKNQRHSILDQESTNNFSFQTSSQQPLSSQDYDMEDDDILLKDLPMTGDETIDQEILSFFRTRQAVFRQINNDKTTKTPKSERGGGSGILANFQEFS